MPQPAQSRVSQIDALLRTARAATPLQSDLGQCFVSLPFRTEAHQIVPLHSKAFHNWLVHQFYSEHEILPRASVVHEIVQLLEAQAQFGDAPRVQISRRIASTPGKVILDLYNDQGEVVEITAKGWSITQNLAAHFRATRSARPLPHPQAPSHGAASVFQKLRALLNLTPEHFTKCMSWLTTALLPSGPYPILVLQGPDGPGKSALAKLLRSLIDPAPAPFCPVPRSSRDLQSLASHNWVIAVDRMERMSSRMLREIIRLSAGEVFAVRDRPSDPEPFQLFLQRPLLFTTSEPLAAELAQHAIAIDAPAHILDCEHLRPQILGALCNAVSAELANPTVRSIQRIPNAIAAAISTFLQDRNQWTGTATELLSSLKAIDSSIQWPATPKGLSQLLHQTPLGNIDFQSLKNGVGRRSIELRRIGPPKTTTIEKLAPMRRNAMPVVAGSRVHSRSFAAKSPQQYAKIKTSSVP